MNREFKIILHDGIQRKNAAFKGIYKMTIGDAYYIGRSINIRKRAKAHLYELQRLFNHFKYTPDTIPELEYKIKLFKYLWDNPSLFCLEFYFLDSYDETDMIEKEQWYLTKAENDPNCVNHSFISRASSYDTRKQNDPSFGTKKKSWY